MTTTIRRRGRPSSTTPSAPPSRPRGAVRYRNRWVELFSSNRRPDADTAYIDKYNLTMLAYSLEFENKDELDRFREHLAQSGLITPDTSSWAPHIRSDWLFSGRIQIRNEEAPEEHLSKIYKQVEYKLALNPSRFAYHAHRKMGGREDEFTLEALEAFDTQTLLRKERVDLLSLDENDNFIPEGVFQTVRPFADINAFYLHRVIELMNQTVLQAYEHAIGHAPSELELIEYQNRCVLTNAEVYWEWTVQEALSFANALWDGFQAVIHNTERRDFIARDTVEADPVSSRLGRMQNVNGVALYANDFGCRGLRLVCYAKLRRRIRFEVRYNRSIRELLSRRDTSGVVHDIEGTLALIDLYIENSAKRLHKFLKAMPATSDAERPQYETFAFFLNTMALVHAEHPSVSMHDTFVQLVNTGRYVANDGSNIHTILEALMEHRIVRRGNAHLRDDGNQTIYHLTPKYQQIITAFRDVFAQGVTSYEGQAL